MLMRILTKNRNHYHGFLQSNISPIQAYFKLEENKQEQNYLAKIKIKFLRFFTIIIAC